MNRKDAIKALVMAGRADEAEALINKHLADAHHFYDQVRADTSRTEEYKHRELAQAFEAYDEGLTEELVKIAGTAVKSDRGDAESVFGIGGLPGEQATLIISRRDAGDRVAGINKPSELQELLARATRSGDEVLARAVAERALETRDAKTLEKFAEDRPHLDAAVERLWKMQRREEAASNAAWGSAILIAGLKPQEFARMPSGSIRALADTPEPAGTAEPALNWFTS